MPTGLPRVDGLKVRATQRQKLGALKGEPDEL